MEDRHVTLKASAAVKCVVLTVSNDDDEGKLQLSLTRLRPG